MAHTEWSAEDIRTLNDELPDGLAVSDLAPELLELDPEAVIEFFREV